MYLYIIIYVRVIIYIRLVEARALAKAEVLLYQLVIIIKQINKDMFNQKEYNKCADFEIILGVISMIVMAIIVLM